MSQTAIGNEPEQCNEDIAGAGDPLIYQREWDTRQVDEWRDLALEVGAAGGGELRVAPFVVSNAGASKLA
jgi:hypothetical protein